MDAHFLSLTHGYILYMWLACSTFDNPVRPMPGPGQFSLQRDHDQLQASSSRLVVFLHNGARHFVTLNVWTSQHNSRY